MTLRDCLMAFGFRFVSDEPDELIAYDKDTGIYVYLRSEIATQVVFSGGDFPGCRTVGDLALLLDLRGRPYADFKELSQEHLDTLLEFPEAGK